MEISEPRLENIHGTGIWNRSSYIVFVLVVFNQFDQVEILVLQASPQFQGSVFVKEFVLFGRAFFKDTFPKLYELYVNDAVVPLAFTKKLLLGVGITPVLEWLVGIESHHFGYTVHIVATDKH